MKIALTDLETTGLDHKWHEIIEIGLVVFDSQTFEIYDTLEVKVKPKNPEQMDPKAREVNGYNEEEWEDAVSLKQALTMYAQRTSSTTFCAFNYHFDLNFLEEGTAQTGIHYGFNRARLDLLSMAYARVHASTYSLKNVCHALGINPEDDMHRAMGGTMKAYEVYKLLMHSMV